MRQRKKISFTPFLKEFNFYITKLIFRTISIENVSSYVVSNNSISASSEQSREGLKIGGECKGVFTTKFRTKKDKMKRKSI